MLSTHLSFFNKLTMKTIFQVPDQNSAESNVQATATLRPYQEDLVKAIEKSFETHRCVMAQLPTGGGKTVVMGSIVKKYLDMGLSVLCVAHRQELILQGAKHLERWTGQKIGIIKAKHKYDPKNNLQFGSVQTLSRRLLKLRHFDVIIIDEAHHSVSNTYLTLLAKYKESKVLGLTATPVRMNKQGFDHLFEDLVCGVTVAELMRQGHLSEYKVFISPKIISTSDSELSDDEKDTAKVEKKPKRSSWKKDYSSYDIESRNNYNVMVEQLVFNYQDHANNGTCLVFAINIAHSLEIVDAYQKAGISAVHLGANSPDDVRADILEKLARKEIKVISNVGLMGEGVDVPSLDCVQIARPTKSLALHLQMLGRVLRKAKGKEYGIILEHTENTLLLGTPEQDRDWSIFPGFKKDIPFLGIEEEEEKETKTAGGMSGDPETEGRSTIDLEELAEADRQALIKIGLERDLQKLFKDFVYCLLPSNRELLKQVWAESFQDKTLTLRMKERKDIYKVIASRVPAFETALAKVKGPGYKIVVLESKKAKSESNNQASETKLLA